jgi:hypothetical protein
LLKLLHLAEFQAVFKPIKYGGLIVTFRSKWEQICVFHFALHLTSQYISYYQLSFAVEVSALPTLPHPDVKLRYPEAPSIDLRTSKTFQVTFSHHCTISLLVLRIFLYIKRKLSTQIQLQVEVKA